MAPKRYEIVPDEGSAEHIILKGGNSTWFWRLSVHDRTAINRAAGKCGTFSFSIVPLLHNSAQMMRSL